MVKISWSVKIALEKVPSLNRGIATLRQKCQLLTTAVSQQVENDTFEKVSIRLRGTVEM